jgi:hypothetical protein
MRMPSLRFTFRRVLAVSVLAGVVAIVASLDRRERLRIGVAIERTRAAYLDARRAREAAEIVLKDYAEGTYRREVASAQGEIEKAEDQLNRVKAAGGDSREWADRIRSKGYLLLIRGDLSERLAVQRATFAVEQARTKKAVLEGYTKSKVIDDLTARAEEARVIEQAKKAAYDRSQAARISWFKRVTGGR